jgi:DNA-binding beta-propeller fold protein YncE
MRGISWLSASVPSTGTLTTLFSFLAVFLCHGGGATYACTNVSGVGVTVTSCLYSTVGNGQAADALVTNKGYVLVSLNGPAGVQVPPAGVQVFEPIAGGYRNPCGGENIISFPVTVAGPVPQVMGMSFFPPVPAGEHGKEDQRRHPVPIDPQISIGAAVESQGAEFFHLSGLDTCTLDGVVNVQQPQPPNANSNAPGTFDLAVTPDGKYAFVANEYGNVSNVSVDWTGTVGIIRTQRDGLGRFTTATRPLLRHNSPSYIYVKGATALPGVTVSHDGRLLYVVHEAAIPPYENPTNSSNPILVTGKTCFQRGSDPAYNGLLTVIDVFKAIAGFGQDSILRTIASACSPTRVVETRDGRHIWVAARGSNKVLAFDVWKLLFSPNDALVGHADSGGTAPVGLALFNNDQFLAVANSNRFTDGTHGTTNVAILDVGNLSGVAVKATIDSENIYSFPRGVTLGPDGTTLYVANFGCAPSPKTSCTPPGWPGRLQVITTIVK